MIEYNYKGQKLKVRISSIMYSMCACAFVGKVWVNDFQCIVPVRLFEQPRAGGKGTGWQLKGKEEFGEFMKRILVDMKLQALIRYTGDTTIKLNTDQIPDRYFWDDKPIWR